MPAGAEFWSSSDAEWATRLATQEVGEAAPSERFIDARARIAWQRIADRRPDLKRELEKRYPGAILGWMIILFALIAGILTDQIGDSKQVNLLAMPFVAIIVWNLAMYVWLLFCDLPWGYSVSRAGAGAGWGACSPGHRMSPMVSSSVTRFHCADVVWPTGPETTYLWRRCGPRGCGTLQRPCSRSG